MLVISNISKRYKNPSVLNKGWIIRLGILKYVLFYALLIKNIYNTNTYKDVYKYKNEFKWDSYMRIESAIILKHK